MSDPLLAFGAPLNPEMPALTLAQVLHGGFAVPGAGDKVRCWEGTTLKPQGRSRDGRLNIGNRGLVFLPEVGPTLQQVALFPVQATLGVALATVEHALGIFAELDEVGEAFNDSTKAADDLAHRLTLQDRVKKILQDKDCFSISYFDIIRASVHRSGSGAGQRDTLFVTMADAAGQRTYAFRDLEGSDPNGMSGWPAIAMRGRILEESHFLETDIQKANIDWASIRDSLLDKYEAAFGETWRDYVDDIADEARTLIAREFWARGFTVKQLATTVIQRFEPMLEHYRRIPMMAWHLECVEAMARGEPASWHPDRPEPFR